MMQTFDIGYDVDEEDAYGVLERGSRGAIY